MNGEAHAELEAIAMQLRQTLARAMTVNSCGCDRSEREHAVEGAAVLLGKLPWAIHSALAAVLLADLHEAAPVLGFDVN